MTATEGDDVHKKVGNSLNVDKSRSKTKWIVAILTILIVIIAIGLSKNGGSNLIQTNISEEELLKHGQIIENQVYKLFELCDKNKDGFLEPVEFQAAYFKIKTDAYNAPFNHNKLGPTEFTNLEAINPDVKEYIKQQSFKENEEIVELQTFLKPFELNTMKKFIDNPEFMDDESIIFHLHGLTQWRKPHVEVANFSVSKFSIFLPPHGKIGVNTTWDLIPKVLGITGDHLTQERYHPPKIQNNIEETLYYLTSMLHPRPFLDMRFPPRGAVACIRAISKDYYDISFRFHPEFQLNLPPRFPYWFTPASIVGNIVIKKDGSHIKQFEMHLPNHRKLNIDMEWITSDKKQTSVEGDENDAGQEVDIGYLEEMRLESTRSSFTKKEYNMQETIDSVSWEQEISHTTAHSVLEKAFYPFKQIEYVPFNETVKIASEEDKLIHHILLWGSLDDQSC